MKTVHRSRGQVLPIWIMGILGTFALIFTALNYGNTLRWHIRAQSAADSAAQATLAIQSTRFNQMMELLYGMNVEEYRIRTLLNGILLSTAASAGCFQTNSSSVGSNSSLKDCEEVYDNLTPQYVKAVQRYSNEAALLNKVAVNSTYANFVNDATSIKNELKSNCNTSGSGAAVNAGGGDCAFNYQLTFAPLQRSGATTGNPLSTVYANGAIISIPSYGNPSVDSNGNSIGTDTENQSLFAPVQVDVITCAAIPPIVPSFFKGKDAAPAYAIGRAAATNVLFVQDWFQPGSLVNPNRKAQDGGSVDFQPIENYGTPTKPSDQNHDFYAVDFGGNGSVAYASSGLFKNAVSHNEMSVRLGWWNSIPVRAFNQNNTAPNPTGAGGVCTSGS